MTSAMATARRAMALLDLTELGDTATEADVRALCRKAVTDGLPAVAAVCVWPRHAALARALVPADIRVATVINFPSGDGALADVLDEARGALAVGADEIDLVMPYKALLGGATAQAEEMIARVKALLPADKRLKVILETSLYPDALAIRAASDLAITAGADFIKTSTGKVTGGAGLAAARAMLEAIHAAGRTVGFKPSGGIRTLSDAAAYLALADEIMGADWATPATFRFGASGLHDALAAVISGGSAAATTGY